MRVGIGYDIHRFNGSARPSGTRPLKLGGVVIPHTRGLAGHSDADVLLHAVVDALLGAVGAADIGEHFPSSDPRYRNADSRRLVQEAYATVLRKGWSVGNVDATVIADQPKLTGYKLPMRRAIAQLLQIPMSQVSVKAKTTEGFAPGGDGIAAQAVVLLKPARGSGLGPPQGLAGPQRVRRRTVAEVRGKTAQSPQPRVHSKRS